MIDSRTRGGGRITVDERAEASGEALAGVITDIGDLAVDAAVGDFDLATLLTQVPSPVTALHLAARRIRFRPQLAACLLDLEVTMLGARAAALACRQAERGLSEVFGGLLAAIGHATGRAIAISLRVLVTVALTVATQIVV